MKLFLKQDILWMKYRLIEYFKKIFLLQSIKIETQCPDIYPNYAVEKNCAASMRDGVRLYSDVYKPDVPGKFPVILIRMPYGKSEYYCFMPAVGKYWAKKGYACVIQDVRGKWASEGVWKPFIHEAQDGYDTLDWIAAQPWCDGNIGMLGESYFGYTQWAVAPLNHPNLKCIAPGDTAADIYGVWFYVDHAFCQQTMGNWAVSMNSRRWQNYLKSDHWGWPLIQMADKANLSSSHYTEYIKHPERDEYWEGINVDRKYGAIQIPVLIWGGWYDVFLKGTLNDWLGLLANPPKNKDRDNIWLLIGPIDHEQTPQETGRIGNLEIGSQAWATDLLVPFFDYYLKGVDNGLKNNPRVKIFVIGDNQWRYENEWPLARTQYVNYYFHGQGNANDATGLLDTNKPGDEVGEQYVYDPEKPIDITYRSDLWYMAQYLKDRQQVVQRPDVLAYTSSIFEKELEITGPIKVVLYAASSACDTDFTATLVDIFPNGYAHQIQEGIVRAKYRNPSEVPSNIKPGEVYEYIIDLWATSFVVKSGHRLRVEISSSIFNRYDRNPNTGEPFGLAVKPIKASQTVYHNASYPSHITLPVIPR
jgi:putative CocE/NonD family hydrolase